MVHYIRFLRPPQFDQAINLPNQALMTALITITTDLGDAFYPGDLSLSIVIVNRVDKVKLGAAPWKAGMRCLKVETKVPLEYLTSRARLFFTCTGSLETDSLQLGRVPYIVSAWTEEFTGPRDPLSHVVVRRFALPKERVLEICEDIGESIACHVWDAAVALTAWLIEHEERVRQPHMTQYSILELGTGCGLVGLVLASMSKNCRLILTDLDEDSLRLATRNAQKSREVFDSVWECSTLEWSEPHKFRADENLALVVASDCIYNSDSIPDLVRTIAHLVRRTREPPKASLGPRVLVSTKRRHSSEDMFFDLMSKAGFKQQEHATIPMYDRYRESTGQAFEQVDIYIFE